MTQEEKQKYLDAYGDKDKVVLVAYGHGWEIVESRERLVNLLKNSYGYSFAIDSLTAYPTMADFVLAQKSHGPYLKFNKSPHRLKLPVEVDEYGLYVKGLTGFDFISYLDLKKECMWQDNSFCGLIGYKG